MRIVLDTNVLMSAIFWKGTPRRLLEAWQEGLMTLVASPQIIEEYARITASLGGQYPRSAEWAAQILELVVATADIAHAPPLPTQVCTDPDDDKFIACALATRATCIVTGDKALLVGGARAGVLTLTPRECTARLKQRSS